MSAARPYHNRPNGWSAMRHSAIRPGAPNFIFLASRNRAATVLTPILGFWILCILSPLEPKIFTGYIHRLAPIRPLSEKTGFEVVLLQTRFHFIFPWWEGFPYVTENKISRKIPWKRAGSSGNRSPKETHRLPANRNAKPLRIEHNYAA